MRGACRWMLLVLSLDPAESVAQQISSDPYSETIEVRVVEVEVEVVDRSGAPIVGLAKRERTFDFQLVAEDDQGRRTEVGPVAATLRRRRPSDAVRGGELEMELRNSAHRLAISLRDRGTDELFVAAVSFSP